MKLSDKITKLRKANGWSQEELAEQLNVSRQAISRWENGTALPDANNLLQLSKLFNVTTDYLLNEDYSSDNDIPCVKEVRSILKFQKARHGKGYIVASVGEAAGEIPFTAYFAKKSYIENNEQTIQEFTNAIYEGQVWVKEHSAKEIAESIQSFFPDTDLEMLEAAVQSYKDIDAWSDTPVLKEEAFNRLQEVMTMAGELEKEAPYNKVVNNKYAEESIK